MKIMTFLISLLIINISYSNECTLSLRELRDLEYSFEKIIEKRDIEKDKLSSKESKLEKLLSLQEPELNLEIEITKSLIKIYNSNIRFYEKEASENLANQESIRHQLRLLRCSSSQI